MRERADDSVVLQCAQKTFGSIQFYSKRPAPNTIGFGEDLFVLSLIGISQVLWVLRAALFVCEIRAFQMQSQNIGHVGTGKVYLIEQLDKLQQGSFGAGDGGWNDACGSVTKMRPACAIDRVEVTVHKVKPARAVRVRFDEAGRKVFAVDINSMLCFKVRQSMVDGNGFYFVTPHKQFTGENAGWENKPRILR